MPRVDVLVVGQGLAGTVLAFELERAGISFAVMDDGHNAAASRVAAGILNPITGQRLVKSWRAETLIPLARETYHAIEAAWGVSLWRDVRIRRLLADDREREIHAAKMARGELAPFAGAADERGFWIHGAGRIDLPALLDAGRAHFRELGRLIESRWSPTGDTETGDVVIDCRGAAGARDGRFEFVPWQYSQGEVLEIDAADLIPDVVLNRGHWVLPVTPSTAWVGATHEPGNVDARPTPRGREVLEASARELLGRPFVVRAHHAGVRVNLPDKRPAAGRHPREQRHGMINGLGAKGAMLAPFLAREWVRHLANDAAFDPEIDVARFAASSGAQPSI